MKKYRDYDQRKIVVSAVRALLDLAEANGNSHISMETLCLIFNSYVTLVQPVKTSGDIDEKR